MKLHGYKVHAQVGRSGLGNLLFPWARAEIFRTQHGLPMLAPQWTQPKVGPLLRREKDLRYYTNLFGNGDYISGPLRLWNLARLQRVHETALKSSGTLPLAEELDTSTHPPHSAGLIVFSGMKGLFEPLMDHRDLIRSKLMALVSEPVHDEIRREPPGYDVSMHIRRGDKPPLAFGEEIGARTGRSVSLRWYVNVVEHLKARLGSHLKVRVFSDGGDEELKPLLAVPGVERSVGGSALAEMLLLSKAPIVVTTAHSTFSQWSTFLEDVESVWYPNSQIAMPGGKQIEAGLDGKFDSKIVHVLSSSNSPSLGDEEPV